MAVLGIACVKVGLLRLDELREPVRVLVLGQLVVLKVGTAKRAWVLAVFEDADKKEWLYQRT